MSTFDSTTVYDATTHCSVTVDNLNTDVIKLVIVIQTLSAHDNVNVVAQIIKEDLPLLSCIEPNDTFDFQKTRECKKLDGK